MINRMFLCGLLALTISLCGCGKERPENSETQNITEAQESRDEQSQVMQVNENTEADREIVNVENKKVKLQTTMGDIVIEMNSEAAPNTVNNFLQYVESGFYDGIIFHRVIPNFMIQTGGFTEQMNQKQPRGPIKNEFKISNTRGTVAMAKLGGDPDSATCQFFISLVDNSRNLDNQNGGFTVFGHVIDGMDVVDKIGLVQTTIRNGMRDVPLEPITIESATVVSQ